MTSVENIFLSINDNLLARFFIENSLYFEVLSRSSINY